MHIEATDLFDGTAMGYFGLPSRDPHMTKCIGGTDYGHSEAVRGPACLLLDKQKFHEKGGQSDVLNIGPCFLPIGNEPDHDNGDVYHWSVP